jgi:hypothetical protein
MNIKQSLEEIINQDSGTWDKPVSFSILYTRAVDIAREALSALEAEKPAEDSYDFALKVMAMRCNVEYTTGKLADDLTAFSESYHAKKCAECGKIAVGWIKVSPETMPKDEDRVFIFSPHGREVVVYNKTQNCWDNESGDDYYRDIGWATFWQPLPEAPHV